MPSIIPSYVYTLFAAVIVGTILIAMCALAVSDLKSQAEKQQLSNIANYIATKSMKIFSTSPADDLVIESQLEIPSLIGGKRYWVQIENDTTGVWVEAGFEAKPITNDQRTFVSFEAVASSVYISGSGPVFLQYKSNSTGSYLTLKGAN
ncbi:MAG: hypothetical protein GX638_02035 [Crenarchaeota archaeon]|nr:hypothetical protein [Thermoproteota archaeon]